jgi:hypothetical protein
MNQPDLCRELYLVQGLAWRAGYDLGQCDLAKPANGAPLLRRSNMPGVRAGRPVHPAGPPLKNTAIAASGRESAMPAARVAAFRYRCATQPLSPGPPHPLLHSGGFVPPRGRWPTKSAGTSVAITARPITFYLRANSLSGAPRGRRCRRILRNFCSEIRPQVLLFARAGRGVRRMASPRADAWVSGRSNELDLIKRDPLCSPYFRL